jgi:hypothetical protein
MPWRELFSDAFEHGDERDVLLGTDLPEVVTEADDERETLMLDSHGHDMRGFISDSTLCFIDIGEEWECRRIDFFSQWVTEVPVEVKGDSEECFVEIVEMDEDREIRICESDHAPRDQQTAQQRSLSWLDHEWW